MPIRLYAHPFSSYCQKVLIALYENALPSNIACSPSGTRRRSRSSRPCGR